MVFPTMKKLIILITAGILVLSACGATGDGITIRGQWARPGSQGGNGAVYFTIRNNSATADELIDASSDVAEAVEIHESKMEGDVMQMNRLMSLALDAKTEMEFKPGGLHIMLIGLRRDLKVGDEIQVTLHFRDSEDITLKVPVRDAAPEEGHMDMNK
jgi:periplasmic copper chaperone A